jgi:hypothetical protein
MKVSKHPATDDEASSIVAHLIGGNGNVVKWLAELQLISVDCQGQWRLSPSGEAAIARPPPRERSPTSSHH